VTFAYVLEDILKDMGYDVERRKVIIGEDLTWKYRYAFLGVAPLSSISAGLVPETHYAMDQMQGKFAVFADDWSFCNFGPSVRYTLERWEKYLDYRNFKCSPEAIESTYNSLSLMVSIALAGNNAPVLAPMFSWGDHEFLMRENYNATLYTVDPSSWVKYPTIDIPTFYNKKKRWIMAALSDHSRWVNKQGFEFPVSYVGNKRMGDGFVLNESQTIQLFADSFGILSCGYPSAGSGWWRTRYLNAAWAETIIYSDFRDASLMGEAYRGSSSDFESLAGPQEYEERVVAQREWLESHLSSKEEVISTIERLIE
jgi:hypothetical protein